MLQLTVREPANIASLPALIDRAAGALTNARTAAEVLEARDMASLAYDAAKRAGRFARAKQAHDDLVSAALRAQADALAIEAQAKARLADEYDAAQERGEVATRADQNLLPNEKKVTAADIGLTHKGIHEARIIRDAEKSEPGLIRRTLDDALYSGDEPTKAMLRRAVVHAATRALRGGGGGRPAGNRNPLYVKPSPANAAVSLVSSCITSLLQAAEDWPPQAYLREHPSEASRRDFIDRARRTRDLLNRILEVAGA